MTGLDVAVRPVLEHGAKLLNGKITVKKILSERHFIAWHDDFKEDFLLTCIPNDENI